MNTIRVEEDKVYLNDEYVCHVTQVVKHLAALDIQRLEIVGDNPSLLRERSFLICRLRLYTNKPRRMIYQIEEIE